MLCKYKYTVLFSFFFMGGALSKSLFYSSPPPR
jgi:hypothetical protein